MAGEKSLRNKAMPLFAVEVVIWRFDAALGML